jgi:hypothetical protein
MEDLDHYDVKADHGTSKSGDVAANEVNKREKRL